MELNIGILVPHSSTYTMLSQYLLRGIKLAFPSKAISVNYNMENVGKGENIKEIVGKANTLLMHDINVCFAMVGSESWQELNSLFTQSGVPLFLLDAGAKINLVDDFKPSTTTFIHSLAMWQSMYALGGFAAEKYKKVVSTSSLFDGGYNFLAAFSRGIEEQKGEITGFHSTQQFNEEDFKVRLKNTINEGAPKALLCLYSGSDADEFYQKCIGKGYDGGLPLLATPLGLGTGNIEIDNITTVSTWLPELDNDENKAFVAAYTAKHKKAPDMFAALAYEAAHTLFKTLEKFDEWDTLEVCEALKNNRHISVRGEFTYTKSGEQSDFPTYIKHGEKTIKKEMVNSDEIKNWNRGQFSSGWFNPYPCS